MKDSINKPPAQEPNGLGRRRPRMAATTTIFNPNIRPWNRPEPPAPPTPPRRLGPNPNAPSTCPRCGEHVERLAVHLRQCKIPA